MKVYNLHTLVKTTGSSLVTVKSCEYNASMDQEIDEYFESALKLTKEAGKIIVEGLHSIKTISSKTSTSDIVTNYDLKVEEKLFKGLAALYPTHRFIGEEDQFIKGTSIVLTDSPTWIIDPIDGTQNFVHSLHFVYISIALSINKQVVLGIAYNPILDILFTAKKGQGAFLNSQPIHVSKVTKMSKALVGANLINFNPGNELEECIFNRIKYITASSQSYRTFGSAVMELCYVAQGNLDAHFMEHPLLHCWDIAAASLLIKEAGGVILDITGGPFELAKERILCASTLELANEILQVVQKFDSSIPNPIHKGP